MTLDSDHGVLDLELPGVRASVPTARRALDGRFAVVLKPGSAVERLFSITGVLDGMLTFSDPEEAESVMREIERAP